ncbi:MAG: cytidylate kinase-like family protein, partial [Thermodesulfobacteriota bacterium]|nr:cytidylate kinase-like family protein [Thermodesulfobacteriota bacterium]
LSGFLSRSYIERILGDDKGYIDEEIYVNLLHDVITALAEQDNVVLIGRGGQYILSNFTGAYHVLLVAEETDRIKFIEETYNLSQNRAAQIVAERENRRVALYKKFGKEDYNQPHLYHLTLNMSRLLLEEALNQILLLVR